MKKPWETWVLEGLSINEAAPLFEKMERIQMEPLGHAFGWKQVILADGRKVKLTIQKNGLVPIYTAIAQGGERVYNLVYVDSGYLSPLNLPPASNTDYRDFPELHQSSRTSYLHALGGENVPNPDTTPLSFWYDVNLYTPAEEATLQAKLEAKRDAADESVRATGKYRLYQQARRGRALGLPTLTIESIANNTTKTTGLYTASDGTYWKVDIEAKQATPEVTFTRFELTDETAISYMSRLASVLDDVELIMETYILSQLELGAETYTVGIEESGLPWEYPSYAEWDAWEEPEGQVYALAEPLSPWQGWKFNWNGNKAAIVLIQSITAASYYTDIFLHVCDYRSHVLELTLNDVVDEADNRTFSAEMATLETNDWQYSHRAPQYWLWVSQSASVGPFYVRDHPLVDPLSFPRPTNTPVYTYYACQSTSTHKNNVLQTTRITFDPDTSLEVVSAPCDNPLEFFGWANGGLAAGASAVYAPDKHKERVLVGSVERATTNTGSKTLRNMLSIVPGAWSAPDPRVGSNPFEYWNTYTFCAEDRPTPTEQIPWDGTTYFNEAGVERYDYIVNGDNVSQTLQITADAASRVIIPYDNAESVIVTKSETTYRTTATRTDTFVNAHAAYYMDNLTVTRQDDYSTVVIATGFNQAGTALSFYPTSTVTVSFYEGITQGELLLFGKYAQPNIKSYESSASSTVDLSGAYVQTIPGFFKNIKDINDDAWDIDLRVMQGIQQAMHLYVYSAESIPVHPEWMETTDVYSGYPPAIVEDPQTVPIGFA